MNEIEWDAASYDRKYSETSCYFKQVATGTVFPALVQRIHATDRGFVYADVYIARGQKTATRYELPTGAQDGRLDNLGIAAYPVYVQPEARWYPWNILTEAKENKELKPTLLLRKPHKLFHCGISRHTHRLWAVSEERVDLEQWDLPYVLSTWNDSPNIRNNVEEIAKAESGVIDNYWAVTKEKIYFLGTPVGMKKGSKIVTNTSGVAEILKRKYGHVWTISSL